MTVDEYGHGRDGGEDNGGAKGGSGGADGAESATGTAEDVPSGMVGSLVGSLRTMRRAWSLNLRVYGLFWRMRPQWFIALTLHAALTAAIPYSTIWFSARLIDELAGPRDPARLRQWVVLILAVTAVLTLLNAAALHWKNCEDEMTEALNRKPISDKLMDLDYPIVDDQRTFDTVTQIAQSLEYSGMGMLRSLWLLDDALPAVFRIVGGVGLSVGLFTAVVPADVAAREGAPWLVMLNGPWAAIAVVVLLLAVAIAASFCASTSETYWSRADELGRFGNRVSAFFGFLPKDEKRAADIRMYEQYERVAIPFNRRHFVFGLHGVMSERFSRPMSLWMAASGCAGALMTGFVYVFVCLKAWGGAFGVGSVTQYVGAITSLFLGLSALMKALGWMGANTPFLERVFAFLGTPNRMYQGSLTTEKRSDRQYDVEFRDVSFRYPNAPADAWALRHVNMRFRVGSRLAVVGVNGSGKTTFIKLLCRLYDPTEGEILLNGIDIRKYRYDEYMRIFSVVFQDFRLFALPLGQNVAAGVHYDRERAADCLCKADFSDRLATLPHGLDTSLYRELDPQGVQISGGEAQKIAIARALYRDAPFIILDEPTAALDPIAEAEIYAKFSEITGDRTAVYISHRLSSCRFCDEIAVFDHGSVIQQGTHEELLADTGGKYAELWHAQAQYYAKSDA